MKTQVPFTVSDEAYEKYVTTKIGDVTRYDDRSLTRFAKTYAHYLRGWLPSAKGAAILEVACGHGAMLRSLKTWGYTQVVGLDRSAEQITLARKFHPEVIHGDAFQHLKEHVNCYDLIAAIDLFEHFSLEQGRHFLAVCQIALRDRGRLIMQLPNAGALRGSEPAWGDITHCRAYSVPALRQFLKLSGFETIEFRETGPIAVGVTSSLRWLFWKCIRLCVCAYDLIETGRTSPVLTRTLLVSAVKGQPN